MLLHWALSEWKEPPRELWPANTHGGGGGAVQTPFGHDGRLRLSFPQVCEGDVFGA